MYFFVHCEKCGTKLQVRANKRNDFMRDFDTGQLVWRKEIMDGKCFTLLHATVVMDPTYRIRSQELDGPGHFITKEEYLESLNEEK